MTTTQNWMGINFSFDNVADERSKGTSFVGIQQCGRHKAELKNLYFSLHGEKNTPALTAVFELEESGKEHIESLWLTKMDDNESVNKKKVKNLISTILYSELTEKEFDQLDSDEVATKVTNVLTTLGTLKQNENNTKAKNAIEKLFGRKVLLELTQTPFIARDKNSELKPKPIKLTDRDKSKYLNELPKALIKVIEDYEEYTGNTLDKIPEFAFKNELTWYGVLFYNDFDAEAKFYNTKAYDYVQALKAEATTSTANNQVADDELIGEDEIPFS